MDTKLTSLYFLTLKIFIMKTSNLNVRFTSKLSTAELESIDGGRICINWQKVGQFLKDAGTFLLGVGATLTGLAGVKKAFGG